MGALVQTKAWLSKGRVCRAAIAVVEVIEGFERSIPG